MTADCANGIGMRVTVFVSGCCNHCPGCFQPETWDFDYGKLYTPEMEDEIIQELSHPYYDGLTLLGGRKYMDGVTDQYLDLIDVLVDGPFVEAQKKITLNFRGSSNQRIIDLKETRKTGTIVLDPLNN